MGLLISKEAFVTMCSELHQCFKEISVKYKVKQLHRSNYTICSKKLQYSKKETIKENKRKIWNAKEVKQ